MYEFPETMEGVIHQAFHELADKYEIDVDLIAEIISEYDDFMSRHLEATTIIDTN